MPTATYQCDKCDHQPFKAPTALGRHKLSAHGIPGNSSSSIAYRKAKEANALTSKRSLAATKPPQTHQATNRLPKPESHQAGYQNQIPEGALAVAFGRFQELCRSFAFEYDLPPKLFTSRLSQLISASAVR
jgi:hypothetical protein